MALQSCSWLTIILCFAHINAVPIKPTCGLQRRLVDQSYSLLESVGGRFPVECLDHYRQITFPSSAFNTSEAADNAGAEKMAYETLKLIDTLFANDSMPTSWNNNLEDFQSLIYRQIEESRCIMSKTHSSLNDFQDRNTALKTFFDKIANILTEKESSICAWEVVRQQILSTLRFILQSSNYLL
ncbi:interferon alpha-1-like [Alosa sapidissima]|uniref:interferon alpha-1-like n=1 Tax=Alosa sapidissima TaxID=34773 RepID=UPI001C091EFF|nr:interferon alpha-1-like [Alosa sapidissima]